MDTDFIGFSYGGINSRDFDLYRVSISNRYEEQLIPQFNENKTAVPGGDGTYFFDANYTQRQFKISFAFDNLSETNYRQLRLWLNNKDSFKQLIFDERPYKYYMAKPSTPPILKTLCFEENGKRVYKGEGEIQFVCYYPFARSVYKYLDQYQSTDVQLFARGYETPIGPFNKFQLDLEYSGDYLSYSGTYYWDSDEQTWKHEDTDNPYLKTAPYTVSNAICYNNDNVSFSLVEGQYFYHYTYNEYYEYVNFAPNPHTNVLCISYKNTQNKQDYFWQADLAHFPISYGKTDTLTLVENTHQYTDINIYNSDGTICYPPYTTFIHKDTKKLYTYLRIYSIKKDGIWNYYFDDINKNSYELLDLLEHLEPYSAPNYAWGVSTGMYNGPSTHISGNYPLVNLDVYNNTNHRIYLYNSGDFSVPFKIFCKKIPFAIFLCKNGYEPITIAQFDDDLILADNNYLLIDTATQLIQIVDTFGGAYNVLSMVNKYAPVQNYVTIPIAIEQYSNLNEYPYLLIEPRQGDTWILDDCTVEYNYLYF